jgi:hypothetical protein
MMLDASKIFAAPLNGFGRTPSEQALENLTQALRALDLAPRSESELCPHPLVIVRAEIENARRYLSADARRLHVARKRSLGANRTTVHEGLIDEPPLGRLSSVEIGAQQG